MSRFYNYPLALALLQCLLLVLSTYGSSGIKTSNLATDQSALLALMAHITSDPDQILSKNWSSTAASSSVCNWIGVQCGFRHSRVTALNISKMRLTGTIPPEFGNLSFLVLLNMSNNNFHGDLPEEFSRLQRLRFVSLSFNNFTGGVPAWFGLLPQLQFLFLASNLFSGSLPSSLSNLTKLEVLNVTNNFIGGTIPPELGNLPSIKELYLSYNEFQGLIPKEIGNLKNLETLYIVRNHLTGIIPREIGNLHKLESLCLDLNKFTGSIPREIGNLSMLTLLRLNNNSLTGTIPEEMGNLQKIEFLRLEYNFLNGSVPKEIFNFSALRRISLAWNFLTGSLPSDMGNTLPNLMGIQVDSNSIGGVIPLSITNCTKLDWLSVPANQFTGSIPDNIGDLRNLPYVFLFQNHFVRDPKSLELGFITALANCKNLTLLALDLNPLNGVLPASIGNLSASLDKIYATTCQIKGTIPSQISNLSSLILLALGDNQLTGVIPDTFEDLQNLQALELEKNQLRGNLGNLCNLQSLSVLSLYQNQFSGVIPECFGDSMTSLRSLQLQENLLVSTLPNSFWKLKDLLQLNLSSNFLSGSLPSEIGNLKAATSIDMSLNQLSGDIPSTMGDLQNLLYLSLAKNNFVGSIPESYGNMLSLTSLDLSNNNFSGLIPKSLEALRYLKFFNVSYNHLRGEIPSGGPFRNFTSASFMINGALCGNAKFQVQPCPKTSFHRSRARKVLLYIFIPLGITAMVVASLALVFRLYWKRDGASGKSSEVLATQERISYYELLRSTGRYDESNLLGTGSFGSVYKGTLSDGRVIAVKVFNLQFAEALRSFDVECEVFRNLRHRNLVKVISICSNDDFKALVLQYMSNSSLEKWLYSHNYLLNIMQRMNIMIDVASALHYLHHEHTTLVIHCDLKPSNVLLDEDMVAHVSDFGIAKMLGKEESIALTKTFATIGYVAPEYGSEGLISRKCDVYSYGIMLMEVFTRRRPNDEIFGGDLNLKSWVNDSMPDSVGGIIDANLLNPNEEHFAEKLACLTSIMELALNCVCESPKDRLSMTEVVPTLKKIKLKFLECSRGG